MATPVEVPKLGNTVEECLIAKWRKQKGDTVAAGEVVTEIETDKASFEVTAPVAGTLLEDILRGRDVGPGFYDPVRHRRTGRKRRGLPASIGAAARVRGSGDSRCRGISRRGDSQG